MEIYLAIELDLPILLRKKNTSNNERKIELSPSMNSYGKNKYEKTETYRECLKNAEKKKLSLCPEGYCTAKEKFEVYPSAYANGYASQVCKGTKPDAEGNTINHYGSEKKTNSDLNRWFEEKWVNVCEKDSKGEYKPCGRKEANMRSQDYPYCRPLNKLEGTKVKSVGELTEQQLKQMCEKKRSVEQGIEGKPTRIYLK
jgi:hypothetical protein